MDLDGTCTVEYVYIEICEAIYIVDIRSSGENYYQT